jgi:hypothetical protein
MTPKMIPEIHWSVTLSVFGTVGFIESMSMVFILGYTCLPESGLDRFCMVGVGLLSYFGQIFLVLAAQVESAAMTAILRKAFDVIFAFMFQIIFFQVAVFLIQF